MSGAVEAVEDVAQLVGRHARAVVADIDLDRAALRGGGDGGDGSVRGVCANVGEQVVDGTAEQIFVAGDHQAGGDVRTPDPLAAGVPGPLGASGEQRAQVDEVAALIGKLVQAGKAEHVVDQPAHALCLERDPAHRLVNLRAIRKGALLVQLGVGAQ